MAGSSEHRRAEQIRAESAVEKAMNGELVKLDSYNLVPNNGGFRVGVPPVLPRNTDVATGDSINIYADFERGFAVYDFSGAISRGDHER